MQRNSSNPNKHPRKVEIGKAGGLYALSSTISKQSGVIVRMLTVTERQDAEEIWDTVSSVCTSVTSSGNKANSPDSHMLCLTADLSPASSSLTPCPACRCV